MLLLLVLLLLLEVVVLSGRNSGLVARAVPDTSSNSYSPWLLVCEVVRLLVVRCVLLYSLPQELSNWEALIRYEADRCFSKISKATPHYVAKPQICLHLSEN